MANAEGGHEGVERVAQWERESQMKKIKCKRTTESWFSWWFADFYFALSSIAYFLHEQLYVLYLLSINAEKSS